MSLIRDRLPSRKDSLSALAACVFPIHVWSIYQVLRTIPSWILSMNSWTLVGTIAYTQVFALLESALLFLGVGSLVIIFPKKLIRGRFVSLSTVAAFLTTAWVILAHLYGQSWRMWTTRGVMYWLISLLVMIVVFGWLIVRFERLKKWIEAFSNRLLILSLVYLGVDVFCLGVVLVRNIG